MNKISRIIHFGVNNPSFFPLIRLLVFLVSSARIEMPEKLGKNVVFPYSAMGVLLVRGITIGDDSVVGPKVSIVRKFPYKNVPKIGSRVWISVNSTIVGPISIGSNVIVAPNSLVISDVPDYSIVAGNPAKIIGDVRNLDYDIFSNEQYK